MMVTRPTAASRSRTSGDAFGVRREEPLDEVVALCGCGCAEHVEARRMFVYGAHANGVEFLALIGEPLGVDDQPGGPVHALPRPDGRQVGATCCEDIGVGVGDRSEFGQQFLVA